MQSTHDSSTTDEVEAFGYKHPCEYNVGDIYRDNQAWRATKYSIQNLANGCESIDGVDMQQLAKDILNKTARSPYVFVVEKKNEGRYEPYFLAAPSSFLAQMHGLISMGLYAMRDFQKGMKLGSYGGLILPQNGDTMEEIREYKESLVRNRGHEHLMDIDTLLVDGSYADSQSEGSKFGVLPLLNFINDARPKTQGNLYKWNAEQSKYVESQDSARPVKNNATLKGKGAIVAGSSSVKKRVPIPGIQFQCDTTFESLLKSEILMQYARNDAFFKVSPGQTPSCHGDTRPEPSPMLQPHDQPDDHPGCSLENPMIIGMTAHSSLEQGVVVSYGSARRVKMSIYKVNLTVPERFREKYANGQLDLTVEGIWNPIKLRLPPKSIWTVGRDIDLWDFSFDANNETKEDTLKVTAHAHPPEPYELELGATFYRMWVAKPKPLPPPPPPPPPPPRLRPPTRSTPSLSKKAVKEGDKLPTLLLRI